ARGGGAALAGGGAAAGRAAPRGARGPGRVFRAQGRRGGGGPAPEGGGAVEGACPMSGGLAKLVAFPRRHPARAAAALALTALLTLVAWEAVRGWQCRQHRRAAEEELARYNFEEAGAELADCLRL